jgi:hypothetical protein
MDYPRHPWENVIQCIDTLTYLQITIGQPVPEWMPAIILLGPFHSPESDFQHFSGSYGFQLLKLLPPQQPT